MVAEAVQQDLWSQPPHPLRANVMSKCDSREALACASLAKVHSLRVLPFSKGPTRAHLHLPCTNGACKCDAHVLLSFVNSC